MLTDIDISSTAFGLDFVDESLQPLSKSIKNNLGDYKTSRRILANIGQVNHTVTSYMTIWGSGMRVRSIKPLKDEEAVKTGAEFVGEGFVLAVSAGVVIFEYRRSSESAARKAEAKRERIKEQQDKLQAKLNTLDIRIKAVEDLLKQQQQLEENKTLLDIVVPVGGADKPKYVEPPKEKLVPIAETDDDSNSAASVEKVEPTPASSDTQSKQQSSRWWKFW